MPAKANLNRLAYFVAIIDEGSITGAAARLGISKAVVSKQLQLLEQDVGTPLVQRDTRKMCPTHAGQQFYAGAHEAVTRAQAAYKAVAERDATPKGRLRITAPVDYGLSHVAPLIAQFGADHPQVAFDLHLSDERTDIIAEGFDLAFRVGWLRESSHLARKLQDFEEIIVASPETASHHSLTAPEDLADITFVASAAVAGTRTWRFTAQDETREVSLTSHSTINITHAIGAVLERWTAFTILPDFLVQRALAERRLMRLLPQWRLRTGGVYRLTAPTTVRSNALTAFLKQVDSDLGAQPSPAR